MEQDKKTALIMLSYNGIETTKRFIDHLYKNTCEDDIFLIAIDNGSTDGSAEYLKKISEEKDNVIFFASPDNLGVIGGRNHGFEMYKKLENKPKYLMFLDNDQYVQEGWFEQHHAVLRESRASVVGVEAWMMNGRHFPVRMAKKPNDPFTYVGCGGMLMLGSVPEKIGMFDIVYNPAYFEDPDFCFRIIEDGGRLAWNYKARIVHLPHQTLGKNSRKMTYFNDSYKNFSKKWRTKTFRVQRQCLLNSLRTVKNSDKK